MPARGIYPEATRVWLVEDKFYPGREEPLEAVVMHSADGYNTDGYLHRPDVRASCHLVVKENGNVIQLVNVFNSAWANGLTWIKALGKWRDPEKNIVVPTWSKIRRAVDPNRYTVSVEQEGYPDRQRPQAQMVATAKALAWISRETGIIYTPHVTLIGHYEISPKARANCPGPLLDFSWLARAANELAGHAPGAITYVTVAAGVNVRQMKSASPTTPIIRKLPRGSAVEVYRIEEGGLVNQGGILSREWAVLGQGYIWLPLLARA